MNTLLNVAEQVALMAPVPFLQPAVQSFKIIWSQVDTAKCNKRQIEIIAQTAAQILLAINSQAAASDPPEKWEEENWMRDKRVGFEKLLSDIADFCLKVKKKNMVKSFLDSSSDQGEIDTIHNRLKLAMDVFQISSQISSHNYSKQVETARKEDQAEIDAALKQLLAKQDTLLALVGQPGTHIMASQGNVDSTPSPATRTTIFGLLADIQDSVKHGSSSAERSDTLQEILVELRKVAEPPRPPSVDSNPILAHLKPGLKPEVLITPLQNHMKQYTWDTGISYCLTSQQCYQFERRPDSSKLFIEHLMSCDDRALQYAALEAFRKDKAVKHFFKKEDIYTPTENPNPLLANLKPGLKLSIVIPPLQYKMRDYTWKSSIVVLLSQEQQGSFFCSGADGCKRFIDYLQESDNSALQYATLDVFRQNKAISFYFLAEAEEKSD